MFTGKELALLAALVFQRFGWNKAAAAAAWRRMMQTDCPDDDFAELAQFGTAHIGKPLQQWLNRGNKA